MDERLEWFVFGLFVAALPLYTLLLWLHDDYKKQCALVEQLRQEADQTQKDRLRSTCSLMRFDRGRT